MKSLWPDAWGTLPGSAAIRCCPEDFQVTEQLGFELSGSGEHVFLYLQKRQVNSLDLQQRLADFSGTAPRDIGFSGLKDRNAVTRQWFSIGMAGRPQPDWQLLAADGDVQVLDVGLHARKLKRGAHRGNRFSLVLRQVTGDRTALEHRLAHLRDEGVPNYFGEQRFGRNGSTLVQARQWMRSRRKISRSKRSLFLSALRSQVFNSLLAARVEARDWNVVTPGDVCMLNGSRSFFTCEELDEDIRSRSESGDIHPGLPLWGTGLRKAWAHGTDKYGPVLSESRDICEFLESAGMVTAWRATRFVPDDFCWQFCDDDSLQLDFSLGAGNYATALLAEFVQYKEGLVESGISSEQG